MTSTFRPVLCWSIGLTLAFPVCPASAQQDDPPNQGRWASLTVTVLSKQLTPVAQTDANTTETKTVSRIELLPLPQARVTVTRRTRTYATQPWLPPKRIQVETDQRGIVTLDGLSLTGSASNGKAYISAPLNGLSIEIDATVEVWARGFSTDKQLVRLSHELPQPHLTFILARERGQDWITDAHDEQAWLGKWTKRASDFIVSYPVLSVTVLDGTGAPVDGAAVSVRGRNSPNKPVRHTTTKNGIAIFTPYDFQAPCFSFGNIDGRAGMDTLRTETGLTHEVHAVDVKVEANGFKASYRTCTLTTYDPKAELVFHLLSEW